MQTFLPYSDFKKSAQVLDSKRLGKQRVEALQIHNIVSGNRTTGGWINHPAVKMWLGFPDALANYHNCIIEEWIERGFNNNMKMIEFNHDFKLPSWIDDDRFHSSHKANLLRKNPDFYQKYGWDEDPNKPYFWPIE